MPCNIMMIEGIWWCFWWSYVNVGRIKLRN